LKVTKFKPPTDNARPRRVAHAPDGSVWICEWGTGMLARFDPKTETFKEYKVPAGGPPSGPGPYPINFDKEGNVWYGAEYTDSIVRLNPKTGEVVDYPTPYAENYSKEFFMDAEGRNWYGTIANNRVGYFTIAPSIGQKSSSK
jgi:virginiamycin B lyase